MIPFMTLLVLVYSDFEDALVALHNEWCLLFNMRVFESSVYLFNFDVIVENVHW